MQLTFDVFSGRPNPSWQLPSTIAQRVFDLVNDIGLLRQSTKEFQGRLGYRGSQIILPAELAVKYRVPTWLKLSAEGFDHSVLLKELLALAWAANFIGNQELNEVARLIIKTLGKNSSSSSPPPPPASPPPQPVQQFGPCAFEMLYFDPAPWNTPAFQPTNNCYAYASNKLAPYPDKPQPGAASGRRLAWPPQGAEVRAFSKLDGAHDVGDCFPDSEAPRLLVALVIWPWDGVPGHIADYHWYRKHPDCWGHKPGSYTARNYDDSNAVITNPETCNRGHYTEFHGYMLMPKSQRVSA
jgi:hypothetical protein